MAEKNIELDSVEIAAAVFGNCDRNIRLLENEFSVTAVCRGTQLRLSGEPANVAAASRAVEGMLLLIENHTPLEDQTVRYCISLAHDGAEKRVRELTEDFVTVTVKGRPIRPKTLGQKEYLNAIRNNAITFGVGPAGTGKTYLAVAMAVKAFKAKEVSRIVLTRPAVEAGEKLGFLPGDLQQKVDPYLRPLYDGLFDMLGAETYERLVEKQIIEVAPLAYMRGRTLDDSFIILDEAQNTTPEQMKMFLTRMGVGSKVVVTGDVTQIDLPERTRSGLVDALHVLKQVKGIAQCYFTEKTLCATALCRRSSRHTTGLHIPKNNQTRKERTDSMSNKVLITNSQKAVKVPSGLRILIRRACNAVLEFEHFEAPAEISVTFVDNAAIAELNNQYRNKPMPTDVLSFPLGVDGKYDVDENNGCKMLGDIVISMERAQEQATLYGHPLQREVAFLTVHSMLHLLGYDHENGGLEAMRMREKEEAVLLQLGLPRTVSYTE